MLKNGYIESKGSGNMGTEQEGLTYFTTKPSTADSYSNWFAMRGKKPDFDKPAYIVSIRKPHESKIKQVPGTGEHEIGVQGRIPNSEITAVYRGNVIQRIDPDWDISYDRYKQKSKSGSDATARLHWQKIQ